MGLDDSEGFTSFPLSHTLPESPLSPPEDGTFSILPRYLLQKVKNTFGAGDGSRPSSSRQSSGSTNASSSSRSKNAVASQLQREAVAGRTPPGGGPRATTTRAHAANVQQPRIASIRDEASSTVSRNHRLSTVGNTRRSLPPVLSRPHAESVHQSPFLGANSLSRSHSQALSTLPEGSGDYSPPPPYSTSPNSPYNAIPGFPIGRDVMDDAKSVSSVAASNTGVTQIFRRLRGEALSRDYWMADEAAVDCYDCNTAFTTWRRKHHCRVCGRIFCSRCASNIIPGARFGHEGLIRVCNICVAILSHRSNGRGQSIGDGSERPGIPASSSVANLSISLPLQSSYRAGQSQYMSSTLFPRNEFSNYNLANAHSVDDFGTLQHRARRFSDASLLRPATPDMLDDSVSPRPVVGALGSPLHFSPQKGALNGKSSSTGSPSIPATTPAPFRKTTSDEDRNLPTLQHPSLDEEEEGDYSPSVAGLQISGLGITDPATPLPPGSPMQPFSAPGTNEGSCDGSGGGPLASSTGRPTTPSAVSFLAQPLGPAFVRSRLNSRAADQVFDLADVDDNLLANPAYFDNLLRHHEQFSSLSTDINFHKLAINHIRRLLRQCLEQASVPNVQAWEDVLLKLLIKVAKGPRPRVRDGDSMDVRRYIKIKRVPGGSARDSEYISGTVFTKSILNKNLPRLLTNPRIMLFDYAFEFEQGETRMSRLDSLRESEKDSLRKLTNSVIDHRPHIVLVGKSVSGLALEYLHKAGIIVARNVKPSALQAAARCTQAGIFDTYQFFPDNTRLGRCAVFRAQTLVHKLIPGGRKTLMRFEGCNKDLSATILLRGGSIETLSKIKRVMRFMTLAAYSVRLELQFLWDEQASLANELELGRIRECEDDDPDKTFSDEDSLKSDSGKEIDKHRAKQEETARIVTQALTPYVKRVLSTSPTIVFPPPHSLERLRQDNATIRKLRSHHRQERTITASTAISEGFMDENASTATSRGGEPEAALQTSAALTRSLSEVSLFSVKPQTRNRALRISAQLAEESQIQEAETRRNDHLMLWESRLARHQDDLNAASHQHLAVLQTVICQTTTRMCDGPKLVQRYYYREGSDQTLREFVESTIQGASQKCSAKGCDRVMLSHYTTYAHGQKRMHVVVEPHMAPPGSEEDILVWSLCRGCELKTLPTTLSEEAANFSFGKYLELSFYSDFLHSRALPCEHNLHSDHIRFLCWRNVALRIMVDPIEVSDIIVPPLRLRVDAWTQLRIKNDEYRAIQKSTAAYWNSVIARIHNFNYDLLPFDRADGGRHALAAYEERAIQDQAYFEGLLDKAYEDTPISQPSALNSVRVALQAKVVQWETEFINFEQAYIPSEGEKARRATSSHLRRLFSDPNSSIPASPDLKATFNPLPSVPASPILGAAQGGEPRVAAAAQESGGSSIMSLLSESTTMSPTSSSEGLPAACDVLPDMPALRLTAENVAILGDAHKLTQPTAESAGRSSTATRDSIVVKPTADEDNRTDSDSTVCAEPPRTMTFRLPDDENRSESEEAVSQRPIKARRPRPVPSIANLVHRFEEGADRDAPKTTRTLQVPAAETPILTSKLPFRPGVRRGKSDFSEVRAQRTRQASDDRGNVLSDGDLPQQSSPARAGIQLRSPGKAGRPRSPAQMRKRPSLNTVPSTSSSSRTSSNLTVPGSRTLKGSLGAPLRLPEREHASASTRPDTQATRPSAVRAVSLHSTNIDSKPVAGRPAPLVLPKPTKRIPTLGPSPVAGNRVSTMTKHFNYLSRQADRERQKQLVLSRQRRARPLAVPRASANVFISSKEALKEDSDDEGSSSGADDEMDGEDEEDKDKQETTNAVKPGQPGGGQKVLDLRQVDQFLRDHKATLPMTDLPSSLTTQTSVSSSEGSVGTDPATLGTGTESGPSIPPSPLIGVEPTSLPQYENLSESEMSSSTGTERQMSLIKTLSSLWSYRGAEFTPLDLPQSKLEHFDAGSRIVVREDEPSSIIAHGLASKLYKDLMKESQNYSVASSSEVFMPESELGHGGNRSSNWDVLDFQTDTGTDLEDVLKKPTDRHLRLAWDDATLKYTIRVFFADQFDALRTNSGCQELFIESLARCHKWDAQGGKSGSAFLKTKDDRFIIKEISPAEMTALLDFAPKYFQYLSRAYFDNLPTVLAKILGVFRISFKSQSSGRNKRMDVLVMENIYYNKVISDQFDLKGSLRNRMVETSSGKSCVLLDENLIQISYDKPFYVREHTKKHLETALHNDSLFLASQKIMDYSLIVGVDRTSTELVVGIVDFLRPYTWDKRLETWVKETAYIGGGPREPTVLNPRIYKNRFREAMSRYFLLVPDRWTSAEAIATGQPPPIFGTTGPSTKSKASQAASILEDQEQFTGGVSRVHSPTTNKRFVPMAG